jgi:hypothetical protein
MRWTVFATFLAVMAPTVACTTPLRTAEYAIVQPHERAARQDECHLQFYNACSQWVWHWFGYCSHGFPHPGSAFGTCFDLSDCSALCRNLEDVWFALQTGRYPVVDVEIYCADQSECPLGEPLAGIYGYEPRPIPYHWNHINFGGLPLCACDQQGASRFIVMITDHTEGYDTTPLSDRNDRNIDAGCESEWRCSGHSYVYRNVFTYCDIYGMPGPLWVSGQSFGCTNVPSILTDCLDYFHWGTGNYSEWLIDCYVSCQGPTATEKTSWSAVKALYR